VPPDLLQLLPSSSEKAVKKLEFNKIIKYILMYTEKMNTEKMQ